MAGESSGLSEDRHDSKRVLLPARELAASWAPFVSRVDEDEAGGSASRQSVRTDALEVVKAADAAGAKVLEANGFLSPSLPVAGTVSASAAGMAGNAHSQPPAAGLDPFSEDADIEELEVSNSTAIAYSAAFRATTDFDCRQDPELEALVHEKGTRTRIYMLYHNNRTRLLARRYAFCKDWIQPYRLRRSPYMESQIYKSLFQPRMQALQRQYDFILTCTYRHALDDVDEASQHWVHPLTDAYLKDLITSAIQHGHDVVPLETTPQLPVLVSLNAAHGPYSVRAWNILLIKMNFNMEQLESCMYIFGFWRSSYLIRTSVLGPLTALMIRARQLVDADADVNKAFRKDAMYKSGDPLVAQHIFGTSYYQMHPFVFERLPAFFLTALNASVLNLTIDGKYQRPEFLRNVTHVPLITW